MNYEYEWEKYVDRFSPIALIVSVLYVVARLGHNLLGYAQANGWDQVFMDSYLIFDVFFTGFLVASTVLTLVFTLELYREVNR